MDVIGFFVVTIGSRASQVTQELFNAGDLHATSNSTASASRPLKHGRIHAPRCARTWASPGEARLTSRTQKYRGLRYSFGYLACPNLEDQAKIFTLLKSEENIGVRLTEGNHLEPEQSTNAPIVHHPQAKYFVA